MSDKQTDSQPEPLSDEESERTDAEPLPDREAPSVITPHIEPPGYTLPIEPPATE
jgi:hypothetical protein